MYKISPERNPDAQRILGHEKMLETWRQKHTEAEGKQIPRILTGVPMSTVIAISQSLQGRSGHNTSTHIESTVPEEQPGKKTQNRYNLDSKNYKYLHRGIM